MKNLFTILQARILQKKTKLADEMNLIETINECYEDAGNFVEFLEILEKASAWSNSIKIYKSPILDKPTGIKYKGKVYKFIWYGFTFDSKGEKTGIGLRYEKLFWRFFGKISFGALTFLGFKNPLAGAVVAACFLALFIVVYLFKK